MNIFIRLALGFVGAAVPVMAFATAPQSVTGITATAENGKVRVSWTQLKDEDIATYRIFYSHASILGNGGLYDDFEAADGSVNTHVLQSVPPVNELFISILAVNAKGEESQFFLEEANVVLGNAPSSSSSASSQEPGVHLLSVEPISATGIVLKFSHPVSIPQDTAIDAIVIRNGSGVKLAMRRFVIEGSTVTVHTTAQVRGEIYTVTIGSMVTGKGENGSTLALATDQTPVLFMGHPTGTEPMSGVPQTPTMKPELTQLRLNAQADEKGAYTVEATWQAPVNEQIKGYSVSQTTDGGLTYSTPRMISAEAKVVKVANVPTGNFGMLIKTVYMDDSQSRGQMQNIFLPASNGQQGSVTQPGTGTNLPNSGPALWLLVSTLGALGGAYHLRARRLRTVTA